MEYKIDSKILDSSRDKEHDDAQFLQIGVSMAKLQPLLNHCKFFMKCIFVISFIMHYTADFIVCAIMPGFHKSGHMYGPNVHRYSWTSKLS